MKSIRQFLWKLRVAWAFLGKFDVPFCVYRIGPRRAWQIAETIAEFRREDRLIQEEHRGR